MLSSKSDDALPAKQDNEIMTRVQAERLHAKIYLSMESSFYNLTFPLGEMKQIYQVDKKTDNELVKLGSEGLLTTLL